MQIPHYNSVFIDMLQPALSSFVGKGGIDAGLNK